MFNKIMYKLFSKIENVYEIKPRFKYYNEIVTRTNEKGIYVINGMSGDRFIHWNNVIPSKVMYITILSIFCNVNLFTGLILCKN